MNAILFSTSERTTIVIGLLAAPIFGMVAGAFTGPMEVTLYALSSLGWVVGTSLLALRHYRQGNHFAAAGMLILTMAEMLLWVAGQPGEPGYDTGFAGAVMFYAPGLLLVSVPPVLPFLVRLTGIMAAIAWALFAFWFLSGQTLAYDSTLALIGYGLIGMTMIGWIVALRRAEATARSAQFTPPALG